jgi:aminoglycoside phosphotransferase
MLRCEDAALTTYDPALAGLPLLFDDAALTLLLQEQYPDARIQQATGLYTRYKPGRSCLVAYDVRLPQAQIWVTACAYSIRGVSKLQKIKQGLAVSGPLGLGGVVLDELAIAITVFPTDRRLPTLAQLVEIQQRRPLLQKIFPDQPAYWEADWRVLRYKPERRCVIQLQSGIGPALLKVYTPDDYENASCAAKRFTGGDNLRIAERLASSDSQRLIVTEWLPGTPLDQVLYTGGLATDTLRRVAAALARLHEQSSKDLYTYAGPAEAKAAQQAARAVAALVPVLGTRAHTLADHLTGEFARADVTPCAIHGDFSADQVIQMADGRWGIIDLDTAGAGDYLADIGMFAAQLYQEAALGRMTFPDARRWCDELVDGYQQATGQPIQQRRLRTHLAARLLRLATGPFRKRIPEWDRHTTAVVQLAEEFAYGC